MGKYKEIFMSAKKSKTNKEKVVTQQGNVQTLSKKFIVEVKLIVSKLSNGQRFAIGQDFQLTEANEYDIVAKWLVNGKSRTGLGLGSIELCSSDDILQECKNALQHLENHFANCLDETIKMLLQEWKIVYSRLDVIDGVTDNIAYREREFNNWFKNIWWPRQIQLQLERVKVKKPSSGQPATIYPPEQLIHFNNTIQAVTPFCHSFLQDYYKHHSDFFEDSEIISLAETLCQLPKYKNLHKDTVIHLLTKITSTPELADLVYTQAAKIAGVGDKLKTNRLRGIAKKGSNYKPLPRLTSVKPSKKNRQK